MKTDNFWLDDFPYPTTLPVAEGLPDQVDVAVIGSGYTGLNAVLTLARSGVQVAVLESERIGHGASSRNGGMTSPGVKKAIKKVIDAYGMDIGLEVWQASVDAVKLVEQTITEENIDCDWSPGGMVGLAVKENHVRDFASSAEWYEKTLGYALEVVGRDRLRTEIGSDAYHAAIIDPLGAGVQPAKYVLGLAQAAARAGATLCDRAHVSEVSRTNGGFTLHTSRGVIQADEVIVATNGYTDRLVPRLKRLVFPVGSYIIVTEPLPPALQECLSPKGRMFYTSQWFLNYFRLTPDGRMLWGGRNNLRTDLDLVDSAEALRRQMVTVFPELADIPITHSWTGKLGITFTLMPYCGVHDGVHYAFGYGGHGLHMATYLGREIAQLVSGNKTRSPFMEIPHQTMFFYHNKAWFLPFAALYFGFRDVIS